MCGIKKELEKEEEEEKIEKILRLGYIEGLKKKESIEKIKRLI